MSISVTNDTTIKEFMDAQEKLVKTYEDEIERLKKQNETHEKRIESVRLLIMGPKNEHMILKRDVILLAMLYEDVEVTGCCDSFTFNLKEFNMFLNRWKLSLGEHPIMGDYYDVRDE